MVIVMKNILYYFYQIVVDENDIDKGYFSYNNHLFYLSFYSRNIKEIESLYVLNQLMLQENMQINQIILNVNGEIITYYENKLYVLLKIQEKNSYVFFKFLLAPTNAQFNLLKRDKWSILWSFKIDYIEYQINHLENQYPLLCESVYYYIGLSENAISYFNMLNNIQEPLYINHRRMKKDSLYNPLELVIDYKVRDITEYFKNSFFYQKSTIDDLIKNFLRLNLNMMDYLLFYIRMLFPSYYFDIYEEIINNDLDEQKILYIINLSSLYEKFLYELYQIIRKKVQLLEINWINKKFMLND